MVTRPIARELPTLRIAAINSAASSRGSIHDDEKAREMGYRGGLVPGVTVLAYMSRLMHQEFGSAWASDAKFHGVIRRPVYEGDEVTVGGTVESAAEGWLIASLTVSNPEGNVCAQATAQCRDAQASS